MATAKANGAEIYYEEAGSGPPIILSPGGLQGVLASYGLVMQELPTSIASFLTTGGLPSRPISPGTSSQPESAEDTVEPRVVRQLSSVGHLVYWYNPLPTLPF